MPDTQSTIITAATGQFSDWHGCMVRIGKGAGRVQRLHSAGDTKAHLYPDWPGANRHERRKVMAEAHHAR